jgi:hypothetical protein
LTDVNIKHINILILHKFKKLFSLRIFLIWRAFDMPF